MKKEEIIAVLKDEGLEVGEDMAVAAVKAAFRLLLLIVPKFSVGLAAITPAIINIIEPQVLAALDKIDGEDDPGY